MNKRFVLLILPIVFTAQACNLFSLSGGSTGSGSVGVFLSSDSGDTWHAAKSGEKFEIGAAAVSRVFVQGDKPQNLVGASTNSGVLASDDHGENWVQILSNFSARDVFINPFNEQEIFAGGAKGKLAAIYKSPDRGATWIQVYNEPVGENAVNVLAFDPGNSRNMYAGLTTGTLMASNDGGDTWQKLASFKDSVVDVAAMRNTVYVLNLKSGFSRSTDGGRTWLNFKLDKIDKVYNDLFLDRTNDSVIYIGSDAGLSRSTNRGETWVKLPLPTSTKSSNVTAVRVNPAERREIYTAVRSTVYRSTDNGVSFRTVQLSTNRVVSDIAVDPLEPNRVFAGLKP